MDKFNFWNASKGVWTVVAECAELHRAIEIALNRESYGEKIYNFNKAGSTFYIRTETYCIRVSSNWGDVQQCNWTLDRDVKYEYAVARISYNDLTENK